MNGGIKFKRMFNDTRGITLRELIIVISILCLLLLIPAFKANSLLNYKERKELKEFKNDINYARNRAIVESKLYRVDIMINSNSYIIFKYDNLTEIIKKKEFTSGIKIVGTNIDSNELVFNHTGAPRESGTINLKNSKGKSIEIRVTPATGKVNIYFD